jgi:isopenicillin N synthase-like dioxygenase
MMPLNQQEYSIFETMAFHNQESMSVSNWLVYSSTPEQILTQTKSAKFFNLTDKEKQNSGAGTASNYQGYFGITKEVVRGQPSHKESLDFGHADNESLSFWPSDELLPGFRPSMMSFHEV